MPIGKIQFFFKREQLFVEKIISTQLSLQYAIDTIIKEKVDLKDYKDGYILYSESTHQQLDNESPVQDYLNDCIRVEIMVELKIRIQSKNKQTTIQVPFETPVISLYYWLVDENYLKEPEDQIRFFSQNENKYINLEYCFIKNDMIEVGFLQAQGDGEQLITIHIKIVDGTKIQSFTCHESGNTKIQDIEDQVYVFRGLAKEACYIALFLNQFQQPFSQQQKQNTLLGAGIQNDSTITAKISWYGGKYIIL